MTHSKETLLIQMGPDELKGLVIDCLQSVLKYSDLPITNSGKTPTKHYVYGLDGLGRLLDCSHPTAQRIKDSGKIPFTQVGRKLIFDADAVLAALNKK